MLRISKTDKGRCGLVEGAISDIIFFYCVWQSHIWPGCFNNKHIGEEKDRFTKEITSVLDSIREGNRLCLHDVGDVFEDGFAHAVEVCQGVGVEVKIDDSVAEDAEKTDE